MNVGFSTSDFSSLGSFTWNVYRSCRDGPESFRNISNEVLSLHAVLKEVEEDLSSCSLSDESRSQLETIGDGCHNILQEIQNLVDQYEGLGTQKRRRSVDRVRWGYNDIAELKTRLTTHTAMLSGFLNTSQVVVEKRLHKFLREFQAGKYQASVITAQTVKFPSANEDQLWQSVRKELENVGITTAAFEANKEFIINWFKAAVADGAFGERALDDLISDRYPAVHKIPFDQSSIVTQKTAWSCPAPASSAMDWNLRNAEKPTRRLQDDMENKLHIQRKRASRGSSLIARMLGYNKRLVAAVADGQCAKVQKLLEKGADPNAKSPKGYTALHPSIFKRSIEAGQVQLEHGADVNAIAPYGRTPLHLAVIWGDLPMVILLLEYGSNVNAVDRTRQTVLHLAAEKGDTQTTQLLLQQGADINAKNDGGRTALHLAADRGDKLMIQLLVQEGAEINAVDDYRWTALHMVAAKKESTQMAQLLLREGADVNAVGNDRQTPLHLAVIWGDITTVMLLLEHGSDVNAADIDGRTALHLAADSGSVRVSRALLEHGASITATDAEGRTALDLAEKEGYRAVQDLLASWKEAKHQGRLRYVERPPLRRSDDSSLWVGKCK